MTFREITTLVFVPFKASYPLITASLHTANENGQQTHVALSC